MRKMKTMEKVSPVKYTQSCPQHWYPILLGCLLIWWLGSQQKIVNWMTNHRSILELSLLLLYLSAFYFIVIWRKHRDTVTILRFILFGSFMFQAFYVLMAPYNISRHDLGDFVNLDTMESGSGHLGYIEYLYNHKHLPNFDPRERWSFYNPPCFHILGAAILDITYHLGVPAPLCYESIQIINLFATSMTIWLLYRILHSLVKNTESILPFVALIAFHPFFALYSASLTNDALCLYFITLALWYTLRWHKSHNFSSILVIALAIGFGMLTKLNVAIICFGIGFIFLWDFWKQREKWKLYIAQFFAFLAICAPIGLYYPIRNYVHFHIPLLYIQGLTKDDPQYIRAGVLQRIGFPSLKQLSYPFCRFEPETEQNIWVQLLRTSLFDEINPPTENNLIEAWGMLLLWITLLLVFICNAAFIYCIAKKGFLVIELRIFLLIEYLAMLTTYAKFCFEEPFICTMNYRYIGVSLLFPVLGAALLLRRQKQKEKRKHRSVPWVFGGLLHCLLYAFIILSIIMQIYIIDLVPNYF